MSILALLNSRFYREYFVPLAHKIRVNPTILLQYYISRLNFFKEAGTTKIEDGKHFFYRSLAKIHEETALTIEEIKSANAVLIKLKFISKNRKAVFGVNNYTVNELEIEKYFKKHKISNNSYATENPSSTKRKTRQVPDGKPVARELYIREKIVEKLLPPNPPKPGGKVVVSFSVEDSEEIYKAAKEDEKLIDVALKSLQAYEAKHEVGNRKAFILAAIRKKWKPASLPEETASLNRTACKILDELYPDSKIYVYDDCVDVVPGMSDVPDEIKKWRFFFASPACLDKVFQRTHVSIAKESLLAMAKERLNDI